MEKKSQARNNEMIRAVRKTEISEQLYYGWSLSANKVTSTKALIIPAFRLFWQKAYRTKTASFILYLGILIFLVKKTFRFQKLRIQNSAKSSTTLCVVAEGYKLYIEYVTWAKTSDNTSHSLFCFAVTAWLRTVFLVANNDWMFWSTWKLEFLWK